MTQWKEQADALKPKMREVLDKFESSSKGSTGEMKDVKAHLKARAEMHEHYAKYHEHMSNHHEELAGRHDSTGPQSKYDKEQFAHHSEEGSRHFAEYAAHGKAGRKYRHAFNTLSGHHDEKLSSGDMEE